MSVLRRRRPKKDVNNAVTTTTTCDEKSPEQKTRPLDKPSGLQKPRPSAKRSVSVGAVVGGFLFALVVQTWTSPSLLSAGPPITVDLGHSNGIALPPVHFFYPDYGGLDYVSLTEEEFVRKIYKYDGDTYEEERYELLEEMDQARAATSWDDELHPRECVRNNWISAIYPNCNMFHEIIQQGQDKFLG